MEMFRRVLRRGDTVLEVGAHIGYISLYFRHLVGEGKVIVFEPGENNLPYLLKNVEDQGIEVIKKAVGKEEGSCSFFLDNLSGQNNSLVKNFFKRGTTEAYAFDPKAKGTRETKVEVITLDRWVAERGIKPDFVKIDIEGFEYEALQGMQKMIAEHCPIMMVEVQMNHQEIALLFEGVGYVLLNATGRPYPIGQTGNIFCFHREKHQAILSQVARS
jgi:FkbM family methyltransferase